ncbi:MAG: cytochrome c biogenesis protein CcsA, partial [Acidobacteria bacterium]|nr:cytochrome c biogenesis protein CcsA [Acidobacteriota bacterium]
MEALSQFADHLSKVYLPGALPLWCALLFALFSLWGYAGALGGNEASLAFGRRAYRLFATSIVLTSVVMALLLVLRDFRVEYVYQYSGTDLPFHYQFAAFWAGQKGSFLIWLFWGAMLGLPLIKSLNRKNEPAVMGIYLLTLLGLLMILIRENPFVMLTEAPVDGRGLNPLLQDDWMVIHPPIMFIGYASTAIPFAFAMAALWRGDTRNWAAQAFPWALGGFLVLGTAILMGGYWAYKTLGWGGFWGWDPVENASLIPWLLDTVLIHGLHMERTRGRYRRSNLMISSLAFLSVLYGTFLTRSGVLADFSVHSFVDLGISGLLIFMMGFFIVLSGLLLVLRLKTVPTEPNEDPLLSRGTFLVLSTIVVLISAIVVTVGTSMPLITRVLPFQYQAGPSFYNFVHTPIAVLIAFLLAAVPVLTWRGNDYGEILKKLRISLAAGVVVTAASAIGGVHDVLHLTLILFSAVALAANLEAVIRKLKTGGLRLAGGYLAHVGVAVMLFGILASSAYDFSTKVTLEEGATQEVNGMNLTFKGFVPGQGRERDRMAVEVQPPGEDAFTVYPKMFVNERTRQLMVNPDIRKSMTQDLYFSPIEFDPGRQPSNVLSFELAKGETREIDGGTLSFVDFDLGSEGNALAQMESGGIVTVGAVLQWTRGDETRRLMPLYRFNSTGQVQSVPRPLDQGGQIAVAGINAGTGAVRLQVAGLGPGDPGEPAKLALDVTR